MDSSANGNKTIDSYAQNLELDVLVVGAGFGGIYALHILREAGFRVKIFEAGNGLGGVWYWNAYPGARVDMEAPYYGYSDYNVWSSYHFPERFADRPQIIDYFRHVDKLWDISKDVSFNTTVVEARFQEDTGRYKVKTEDGRTCTCTYLIAATGVSFKPHFPNWKGIDSFKGEIHHSAYWSDDIDLKGKTVAVIGAGASGVQIVQEAAKVASHLTQFIRTPNLAIPMRQRKVTEAEFTQHTPAYPFVFKHLRTTFGGLPIVDQGKNTFDVSDEEREAVFEEQWKRGGFHFQAGTFSDYILDKKANLAMYDFWAKKQRARVSDPIKRDLVAPIEAPYYFATKRSSLEQDYYEMIDQPHVTIENSPILELNEKGIVTDKGLHEFDVIAVATGFDAVTGPFATLGVKGHEGIDIKEKWKDGVKTHLGMMINDFPNFFMVYGPQAPTSFTNGPAFIEMECEWIRDVIMRLREENLRTIEPTPEAEQAWVQETLAIADMTLAPYTNSWYMGANIPGKKREFLIYLGSMPVWHQRCLDALDGWKSFTVKSVAK